MKSVFRRFPGHRLATGHLVRWNLGWNADKVADDFFEFTSGNIQDAEVIMSSDSIMGASGGRVTDGSISFHGYGDAPFSGNAHRSGEALIEGVGVLDPVASRTAGAEMFSEAGSDLSIDPIRVRESGVSVSGASSMTAESLRDAISAMEALADSLLEGLPQKIVEGLAQCHGVSDMGADGWKTAVAAGLFFGSGELYAEAEEVFFMAQINPAAFQIIRFTGMNPTSWSVVSVPPGLPVCRRVIIRNMSANTIQVCTDPENANAIDTIAGNATYTIPLTFGMFSGYGFGNSSYGSDVCLIKGSGPEQPLISFLS